MAVQLPHSIFFHIPKTGGTWVRHALHNAGIPLNEIIPRVGAENRASHMLHHCVPADIHTHGAFTFAFVRNPFTFYQSYWSYMVRDWGSSASKGPFARKYIKSNFGDFLRAITTDIPGWITNMYRNYVGKDRVQLSFVGRQEHLVDDLVHALHLAGETFDEHALRATPSQNKASIHPTYYKQCMYTPKLAQMVIESEIEAFQRFGYSTNMKDLVQVA